VAELNFAQVSLLGTSVWNMDVPGQGVPRLGSLYSVWSLNDIKSFKKVKLSINKMFRFVRIPRSYSNRQLDALFQ
jgi:hypothetical protein